MSNFEYLMALNAFAGRTVHDLTQYPVFPWVLADYVSATLDLTDPTVYRDLSKPMGCQIGSQEAAFQARYRTWADDSIKAFHYGSHYSTAGSVLWYLLRLAPFTDLALELQEGHFDCPDRYSIHLLYWYKSTITDAKGAARLFRSIGEAYYGCTHSTTDVKELIPEFFYLPDFLVNINGLDLGVTQHGQQVDAVQLPPWARDAADFVAINRQVRRCNRTNTDATAGTTAHVLTQPAVAGAGERGCVGVAPPVDRPDLRLQAEGGAGSRGHKRLLSPHL